MKRPLLYHQGYYFSDTRTSVPVAHPGADSLLYVRPLKPRSEIYFKDNFFVYECIRIVVN